MQSITIVLSVSLALTCADDFTDKQRYQERLGHCYGGNCWHRIHRIWLLDKSPRCSSVCSHHSHRYESTYIIIYRPGMGLNAYFTFQVVGVRGGGSVSYRLALTAVFIEGFIFVFLSLIGMRQWLVRLIPGSIKVASGVGIGLFLTEIGLSSSGIGMISGSRNSPTDLAGCPSQYVDPTTGECTSHKMTSPKVFIPEMVSVLGSYTNHGNRCG